MKVLHILNELQPSGAEVMLRLAVPHWRAMGIETTILATGPELGRYAQRLEDAGCSILHLPAGRLDILFKWRAFYKIFSEFQVIHIHTQGKSHLFAMIARMAGVRVLVKTIHNNFNFPLHTRIRTTLERWTERLVGVQQIAISDSVHSNEAEQYFNQCRLIRNWIDANHFRPPNEQERKDTRKRLNIADHHIVLVSVGNGSDTKNYQAIVGALHQLGDSNLHYFQVGMEHPDKVDRQLAASQEALKQIKFVGSVDDPRVYLWAADVYLMTSQNEGASLAAAEALACSMPCIFARSSGLTDWEFLGEQIKWSGIDAESVANSISEWSVVLKNSERATFENEVRQIYSAERGATEYAALYNVKA